MKFRNLAVLLAIAVTAACNPKDISGGKAVVLNEVNFEEKVIDSSGVYLVDFYADWCPPCKKQGPIVEELADEYSGRVGVGKVDIDDSKVLAARYSVRSIPTLILFVDGKQVETLVGLHAKDILESKIDEYLVSVPVMKDTDAAVSAKGEVILFNDDVFDKQVLAAEGLFLIDFYADWCPPCKKQGPIVEDIAKFYAGKMTVGKVDVDKSKKLSAKYGIRSIPTLIFFRDGEMLERLVGLQSQKKLEQKIKEYLK